MLDYRKIEYFLKAAELLNFSETARQLYISPQALVQQIASLEDELGCKLFNRSTRKVELTEMGMFCYQKFRPVQTAFENASQELLSKISQDEKNLRVGFFNGLPKKEVVNKWLNLLETFLPDIELEIISTDLGTIWKYIDEGKLDICLTNVDSYFPIDQYEAVELIKAPAQIVISMMHPWFMKDEITPEDLKEGEMLQLRSAYRHVSDANFYSDVECKKIVQVADFDTMLAMLETGKSFAVFPKMFDYHNNAKFKYYNLPDKYELSFMTVCASAKDIANPRVKKLLEYIANEY